MSMENDCEANAQDADNNFITLEVKLPLCIVHDKALEVTSLETDTLADFRESLSVLPLTQILNNYEIFWQDLNLNDKFDDMVTFEEILTELGLSKSDSFRLILKERPYNLVAVYSHIAKFRESAGLHYIDKNTTEFGCLSGGAKFHDASLDVIKPNLEPLKQQETNQGEKENGAKTVDEQKPPSVTFSDQEKHTIEKLADDLVSPQVTNLSRYGTLTTPKNGLKVPLKSLQISQWSPVPPSQQAKGDLLYLTIQTLENETFQITCHITGFFVNRSSSVKFNPVIKVNENGQFHRDYLLINLVDQLSPLFSKVVKDNERYLSTFSEYPESYLLPSNCLLSHPWIVDSSKNTKLPDFSRSQMQPLENGVDGADFLKEWNEDFQAIRELPVSSINERILRDKLLVKLLHEFNKVATETAINIAKGNIPPLNPNRDPKHQIYLRNGIFYSLGVNSDGAFDSTGGSEAARYVSSKDLASVKLLNRFDASGIYILVSCIVDYMGQRIICQAPVPGIFQEPSHEDNEDVPDKVSYGLSTDSSKILTEKSFEDALRPIAEAFHLKPHKVSLSTGAKSEEPLIVSKDMKGIVGSDGRKYVIDLYRSTPIDIEFIEKHWEENSDTSYPHKEASIRHEAVEEWWKRKVSAIFKAETEKLESEGKLQSGEAEKPLIALPTDDVAINTDSFTGVNEDSQDQAEVREISIFVRENLVAEFLEEIVSQISPFDGEHLSSILHRRGINLRYLGYIADQILIRKDEFLASENEIRSANQEKLKKQEEEAKSKPEVNENDHEKGNNTSEDKGGDSNESEGASAGNFEPVSATLTSLYKVIIQEMVARAAKHLLRKLSFGLPNYLVPYLVSHFHNCLLGSKLNKHPECLIDENLKSFLTTKELSFTELDSDTIFAKLEKEVLIRFRYTLPCDWITSLVSPSQLLREVAHKVGIQWKAQDYPFTPEELDAVKESMATVHHSLEIKNTKTNKNKKQQQVIAKAVERTTTFVPDDIIDFVPVVKDSIPRSKLLDEVFETARHQINKGEKDVGLSLLGNLATIYEQIYGKVHPETGKFHSLLSQYYGELGLSKEACDASRKACVLMERTLGFDSFETITCYINLAYFESTNGNHINALKLYNKAIQDWQAVYGKYHPSSVNTFANLAELLSELQLHKLSNKLFEKSIKVSEDLHGPGSQITGMLRYRFGGALIGSGDFSYALQQFKKAAEIFNVAIGPDDKLSIKASNFVSNISTYLSYNERQKAEKKKQLAEQTRTNVRIKGKANISTQRTKHGKKKSSPTPDPAIASKSVDEILNFIEGRS